MQRPNAKQTLTIPAWVVALAALIILLLLVASYIMFWPRHRDTPLAGPATGQQTTDHSTPSAEASRRTSPAATSEPVIPPPPPVEVTIPASTAVAVRTTQLIDGDADPLGSRFSATLIAPVLVDGQPAIAQGSAAIVRLVERKKAGFFHRSQRLKLALAGISVNGRIYPTQAETIELKGGNPPGGGNDSDNSEVEKPKGTKGLVVLPNTPLTFTLSAPLTITVPAGGVGAGSKG
jgi:hypothetical protein